MTLAGCPVTLYEADARIGGRMRSEMDAADPRQVWELGGEFIDSAHDDMHALAEAFGVEVFDTLPTGEERFVTAYHFGGQAYTADQISAAFDAVVPRIAADVAAISARPSYRSPNAADQRFDAISVADYLHGLALDSWLNQLITVAYVTVYGLDAGDQSALNLLTLIGTEPGRFEVFGSSDERYKLRKGSQALTDAIARRLGPAVETSRRLVRLRRSGGGWVLAFDHGRDAHADAVVLALPFTTLRLIDLGDLLPPVQRRAVDELGYGMNAKLMLGTHGPIWRAQGFDGGCYTDGPLQTSWDCSRLRGSDSGVFTVYQGGREGVALGLGSDAAQAARLLESANGVFPGLAASHDGRVRRANWPSEPFALGSYTCYRPGQWTSFGGAEGEPVADGLFFAGEHCAASSQGYMNGAAETGRAAALAILHRSA
jgi:monoamine oxidase